MSREIANLRVDLQSDPDWRKLSPMAQHLYWDILTHPTLNRAGVADWRPSRMAAAARFWSAELILAAAEELQAARFIYADNATEEVFVRSFVRHDGLLLKARLPVTMCNDFAAIASEDIRAFFVFELGKLRKDPDYAGLSVWERTPRIATILKQVGRDMKAEPWPTTDEFWQSHRISIAYVSSNGPSDTAEDSNSVSMASQYVSNRDSIAAEPSGDRPIEKLLQADSIADQCAPTTATATATSPNGDKNPVVTLTNYVTTEITAKERQQHALRMVHGFLDQHPEIRFPSKTRQDLTAHVMVSVQDRIPPEHITRGLDLWFESKYQAGALPGFILQAQQETLGGSPPGAPRPRRATGEERAIAGLLLAEELRAEEELPPPPPELEPPDHDYDHPDWSHQ